MSENGFSSPWTKFKSSLNSFYVHQFVLMYVTYFKVNESISKSSKPKKFEIELKI